MSGSTGIARPLLDDVAADDARVVGGAAGDDDDAAKVLDLELGEAEPLEHEPVARTRSPIVSRTASGCS